MACPHYRISIVKRSIGDSAVAASAYQSRSDIFNDYRQQTEYYSRKKNHGQDIVHLEVMLPENAPREFMDRGVLWNSVEQVEDQRNSQLARRIQLSLPNEVPREQWVPMLREYIQEQFVSKGMCADVAIHYTEPPPNPHAHILLTLRSIDENGHWLPKYRKVPCTDQDGNIIHNDDDSVMKRPENTNGWNDRGNAEIWRSTWADKQNEYLSRNGSSVRVDLRSYKRQGILKIPTVHLGKDATALVRHGEYSYLNHLNEDIKEANGFLEILQKACKKMVAYIENTIDQKLERMEEKELKKHPPIAGDLYAWWALRNEQRESWKSHSAQLKCSARDFCNIGDMVRYATDRNLYTWDQIHEKLDEMESKNKSLRSNLKKCTRRMQDIEEIISAAETVMRLKTIHNKSKFGFSKQSFSKDHENDLKEYDHAYATLMRLNHGTIKIDIDALKREKEELSVEKMKLEKKVEGMKPDLTILRKIRKCINAVEADLDHEDRKPSVREQLRQYQSQQHSQKKTFAEETQQVI